ncbi:MAG: saccharopine dehydrogenase NADP-binding domain-containing protein [Bacteroidota bacterium]|nr:saccharopine dehydrogenase NADP-binding domain-containing protein [Bacteroidota bacterium]MDX5430459.1 saccharopine dehydrogenase NADP-binding domain-containing protein [Bacteroidota bacterium]MDX5469220.1 saccharopine dehydrogenase NADP-binding domain-containing protein [Bacteroidota bacterium]
MANILLFGAGKSASYLIRYFLERASEKSYLLTVCDPAANQLKMHHPQEQLICANHSIEEVEACLPLVEKADVVISLLPAFLHEKVARLCLIAKRHLVTASYVDAAMQSLHEEAKNAGLCFLNEAGLDPGIDHMSAMNIFEELKSRGAVIDSFLSYTGGLIAPESDTNPWHYKLSWNPINVVLAGSGSSARYKEEGELNFVTYPQMFQRIQRFELEGYGAFEGYPNRDSLGYVQAYGLEQARTVLRGTLRRPGYCSSWNALVQLGLTDDSYQMTWPTETTGRKFLNAFLPYHPQKSLEDKIKDLDSVKLSHEDLERLEYLGLFSSDYLLPKTSGSPAQILQAILEEKWRLEAQDRDLIVMIHQIGFTLEGKKGIMESSLAIEGEDARYTAMAKTVGLPAAMCAEEILHGNLPEYGVSIPIQEKIYSPVLRNLSQRGITFQEKFS